MARSVFRTLIALVLLLLPTVGAASWVVNENDECVQVWDAASLLRGPIAIVNAPLLPLRSAAGGVLLAFDGSNAWAFLYAPPVALISGTLGIFEGVIWIVAGLADTATGGYFEIASDEAVALRGTPIVPLFVPDARRPAWSWGTEDRCGRGPRQVDLTVSAHEGQVIFSASAAFNRITCSDQWRSGRGVWSAVAATDAALRSVKYGDPILSSITGPEPLEPEHAYTCRVDGKRVFGEVKFCLNRRGEIGTCARDR